MKTKKSLCSVLFGLGLTSLGFSTGTAQSGTAPADPAPVRRERPYLLFAADRIDDIRETFSEPRNLPVRNRIIREADRLFRYSGNDTYEGDPENWDSWKTWAQLGEWGANQTFTWAYILTGDSRYSDALRVLYGHERRVRKDIDPDQFRFEFTVKRVGVDAALAYDVLWPILPEEERRAFGEYLDQYLVWMSKPSWGWNNNIGTGYFSAVGLIALARLDENPHARRILEECVRRLKTEAYPFSFAPHPDGAYPEGPLYMDYLFLYLLPFLESYERVTGDTEHGLLDPPFFRNTHRMVETLTGGDGVWVPVYDSQPQDYGAAWTAYLGDRFDNDLLRWASDHYFDRVMAESSPATEVKRSLVPTILFRAWDGPAPFPGLPTLAMLPSINTGSIRSDDALKPGLMVTVRGFGENENNMRSPHKDVGSFVLYARGENFLIDPGYKQPEPGAHSLPEINGMSVQVRTPSPLLGDEKNGLRTLTIDPTLSYRGGDKTPTPIRRTWVMAGDKAVVLVDDIRGSVDVVSRLQAGFPTEIQAGGSSAVIAGNESDLWLGAFGPDHAMDVTGPIDFGQSWTYAKLAKEGQLGWHRIEAAYKNIPEQPMVWVFVPRAKGEGAPEVLVRHTPENIFVRVPGHADIVLEKTRAGWRAAGLEPRPGRM